MKESHVIRLKKWIDKASLWELELRVARNIPGDPLFDEAIYPYLLETIEKLRTHSAQQQSGRSSHVRRR